MGGACCFFSHDASAVWLVDNDNQKQCAQVWLTKITEVVFLELEAQDRWFTEVSVVRIPLAADRAVVQLDSLD